MIEYDGDASNVNFDEVVPSSGEDLIIATGSETDTSYFSASLLFSLSVISSSTI